MKRRIKVIINGKATYHEHEYSDITQDEFTPLGQRLLNLTNVRKNLFSNARALALKAKFDTYFAEQDKLQHEYDQMVKEGKAQAKQQQEEETFRVWMVIYILGIIGAILYFIFK